MFALISVSSRSHSDLYPGRNGTPPLPRSALTIASHELRGRPVSRASVSITALSAGNSPPGPFSKWIPFMEDIQRVLSPPPFPTCNGKCPLPTEGDTKYAHVVSDVTCTLIRLTVGYRYPCLLVKIMKQQLTILTMERSQRYVPFLIGRRTMPDLWKFFIDHLSELPNIYYVSMHLLLVQGAKPKSTLRELLLAIRFATENIVREHS